MAIAERTAPSPTSSTARTIASASGRTFATIDPSTGAEIAQVAFGEAEDVDRAVAAGRAAFESGRVVEGVTRPSSHGSCAAWPT